MKNTHDPIILGMTFLAGPNLPANCSLDTARFVPEGSCQKMMLYLDFDDCFILLCHLPDFYSKFIVFGNVLNCELQLLDGQHPWEEVP